MLSPELIALNRASAYGTVSRWLLHDLRNPAQTLTLITELMDAPGSDQRLLRDTVRDAAAHLARSLELLARALHPRHQAGKPGPVSLREVLEFLVLLPGVHRSALKVNASGVMENHLPAVHGVAGQIEHALLNLMLNAFEAGTGRVKGVLSIAARIEDDRLVLTLSDDGPGVASAMRERLFQPYASTKLNVPLAGLGLAVARHLVESHGGSLDYVPSEAGATFVMRLLLYQPARPSSP